MAPVPNVLPSAQREEPVRSGGLRASRRVEHLDHRRRERVARRTNYGFEKRQRELKKQKKKQDKAERRRLEEAEANPASSEAPGGEKGRAEPGLPDDS